MAAIFTFDFDSSSIEGLASPCMLLERKMHLWYEFTWH